MPRKAIDYNNTVIYKIQHIEKEELLYVGHTTDFRKRKNAHKSSCNVQDGKQYNVKVYKMIRDNGGWEMFKMIQVKEYPCNNRREAEAVEDQVMTDLKATLNSNRAILDKKMKDAKYYENHMDQILSYQKQYREKNKEKRATQTKEWLVENRDHYLNKLKEYRECNIDRIKQHAKEKIICECGRSHNRSNRSTHLKSKFHAQNTENKNI